MDEAKLRILIEAILDDRGLKAAKEAVEKVGAGAKNAGKEINGANEQIKKMGSQSDSLINTFSKIGFAATATVAPIISASKYYVSSVNMAEETSRKWLGTQYEIEQSNIRIGRVGAQTLLPFFEKYSEILEGFSEFTEENPGQGMAALGATGLLGGTAGIVGLKSLLGGGATAAAGATAGAAGAGSIIAPLAIVALAPLLGVAIKEALYDDKIRTKLGLPAESDLDKLPNPFEGRKQAWWAYDRKPTATVQAQSTTVEAGDATNDADTFFGKIETWLKKLLGLSDQLEGDDKSSFKTTSLIKAQYDFRKQETYAQEDFARQRLYALADFERQRGYQEQDFYRQRGYTQRDFNIQFAQSEMMFYRQRAIALRDFNISLSRNEYDYNLSRARAAEDHNFSLKQIMLSGDALSYYYSKRQFEIDKRRAEEDYQRSKQRSKEDFDRSQGDQLQQYNIERAFQRKMFEIHMADQEIEYQIQRERAAAEFTITLRRQEVEYKIMAARRWDSFMDSILPLIKKESEMRAYYEGKFRETTINGYVDTIEAMQRYTQATVSAYYRAMYGTNNSIDTTAYYVREKGGYSEPGIAVLHPGEYVLNASTTKAAERAAQGVLTQDKIITLLSGGGNGGMTYQDNRTFSRGLDPDEKQMLRQELRQIVVEAFR